MLVICFSTASLTQIIYLTSFQRITHFSLVPIYHYSKHHSSLHPFHNKRFLNPFSEFASSFAFVFLEHKAHLRTSFSSNSPLPYPCQSLCQHSKSQTLNSISSRAFLLFLRWANFFGRIRSWYGSRSSFSTASRRSGCASFTAKNALSLFVRCFLCFLWIRIISVWHGFYGRMPFLPPTLLVAFYDRQGIPQYYSNPALDGDLDAVTHQNSHFHCK